jgi:voltage-gated sodium channel
MSVVAAPSMRQRLGDWIESPRIQKLIIGVILANAVVLGLETSARAMAAWGPWLIRLDQAMLTIFVIEIALKLYARGFGFFRSAWNVFDFVVVGIALIPASGPFAVLRALRVLRVLRLVSVMPRLRFVVEALLAAIPGIAAIAGLMAIIYYVFAVIATKLFGPSFPQWFGTLGASLYSLFQIMTLESWSMGIVRPVMEVYGWAWAFFVPFILVATFTMLNLFIAIIVNTMQSLHDREKAETLAAMRALTAEEAAGLEVEVRALRREVESLRDWLHRGRPG